MKRNFMLSFVAVLFLGMALAGCEEEHGGKSHSPVYKDLTLSPNPVNTGQIVTGIVSYNDPGANIYSCDYQYTISDGTSFTWRQVDPTTSQPEFTFTAPERAGNYTVTFRAPTIRYSSTAENGTIYGVANMVQATLKVQPSDVINANWGDKKDDLISKINATDSSSLLVWKGNVILVDETSTDMAKDTLIAKRLYYFDNNGLSKVEQTSMRQLTAKSVYNTAMEQYQLDSLVNNYKAAIDILGLRFADILYDYAVEDNNEMVLTGPGAAQYPVSQWARYGEKQKSELVRAFWRGEIKRYDVTLYSNCTKCVASAYVENDNLVLKWVFTKL